MDDPQISTLEAAQWLTMRMHDPEIQVAVAGALRRGGHASIGDWAKASPGEVTAFAEALDYVAEQDAKFEADVLNAGRIPTDPMIADIDDVIDWGDLAR